MEARPRDAAATRLRIMDAARELFASRGYHGSSIRQIADKAEVDHALVLRYFGNKEQLLKTLLGDEALGFAGTLDADEEVALQELRQLFTTALTEGRQVMRLLLRAELDGVTPERPFDDRQLPMGLFAEWLETHDAGASGVDPRAFAMLVSAAGFGLVAAEPLLAAAVGWQDEDPDAVREKCVEAQVALTALLLRRHGGAGAPAA
jgi:AcrR family transcriptional regulator